MFDDYSATLPLLIVVLLENVAVAWVYGTEKYVTCKEELNWGGFHVFCTKMCSLFINIECPVEMCCLIQW